MVSLNDLYGGRFIPRPGRQPHSDGRGPARPSLRQAALGHAAPISTASTRICPPAGAAGDGGSAGTEDAGAQRRGSRWARVPYNVTPKHTAQAANDPGTRSKMAGGRAEGDARDRSRPAHGRSAARSSPRYMVLPNYRNNWLREGFSEAELADGGSDRFIDAMVPVGRCGDDQEGPARAFRRRRHPCLPAAGPCRRRLRRARHACWRHWPTPETEKTMDFGIALPTAADLLEAWRSAAEELGFSHAWFYDTQMLSADCFVAMGAGGGQHQAHSPRHRRAGAVQPHRAGRRQCAGDAQPAGARPHRLRRRHRLHGAARHGLRRHQGQGHGDLHRTRSTASLRRETVDFEMEGQKKQNPLPQSRACRCSTPRIRSRCISLGLRATHARADGQAQGRLDRFRRQGRERHQGSRRPCAQAWRKAGHAMGDLQATAFALGCVLQDGEPADSERAMAQAGTARRGDAASRRRRGAGRTEAPGVPCYRTTRQSCEGYHRHWRAASEPEDAPYLREPSRASDVREARGKAVRHRRADPPPPRSRRARPRSSSASMRLRGAGYTQFTIQLVPGREQARCRLGAYRRGI